jgi:putative endonuclease
MKNRAIQGERAYARGVAAEAAACAALAQDGWVVLGRRMRGLRGYSTGEIDVVAEKDGLLAFIEVKARATMTDAAFALGARQRARLLRAAEVLLAAHPDWGNAGVRFDVMLVDANLTVRRIRDAFRLEDS